MKRFTLMVSTENVALYHTLNDKSLVLASLGNVSFNENVFARKWDRMYDELSCIGGGSFMETKKN